MYKISSSEWILSIYLNLLAISNWVSISLRKPNAMYKNWINSFLCLRPAPSAMLEGILIEAHLIWLVKPNFSDSGNLVERR